MKIILTYLSGLPDRKDPYISLVPTGLSYLHACLKEAGYDSILVNFSGWSTARIDQQLLTIKPDMIGISQWTHNRLSSLDLASRCRKLFPESTIIVGGGHASFCYDDLLYEGSPVDCVVIGEGEQTLLELTGRLVRRAAWQDIKGVAFRRNGNVLVNDKRPPLVDLDQLPIPARYLEHSIGLDMELQPGFLVTARGCPSSCHFCSSPAFWGNNVRFRSAQSIVDEVMYIRNKFGIIYFSIRDDTFTADRRRTLEFCSALINHRVHILWNCQSRVNAIDEELLVMMKRAGCECIQLGIESGSPRILKQLGKKITPAQIERAASAIKKVGINLSVYLISDVPGETAEDEHQTIDLLRRILPDDGYVSPLAYYPGTRLFTDAVASGITDKNFFADTRKNALFATIPGQTSGRLLKLLSDFQASNSSRFDRQKQLFGYCCTTNILAGEQYRQNGDQKSAEREFKEIIARQPDNPWGWFLLGELYTEGRKYKKARTCYSRVLEIVPRHGPSRAALNA